MKVKKLNEDTLNEMALDRQDAIDRCISLGKPFVKHFDKIINDGLTSDDFKHHCGEMRGWLNEARAIKLKYNNKNVSKSQLHDWFFTLGSSIEDLFDSEIEIDLYNDFIFALLNNLDLNIEELFINLLN